MKIINYIYHKYQLNKIYFNVNKSKHSKNVLISYITQPFTLIKRNSKIHTNIQESIEISKCFDKLGYSCDIVNNSSKRFIKYDKYNIIFGFGEVFEKSLNSKHKSLKIYYGTGRHPYFSNEKTRERGVIFKHKHGILPKESLRFAEGDYESQTQKSDALLLLGDETVVENYKKYVNTKTYKQNASFIKVYNPKDIIKERKLIESRKHFLFFSGGGMIHKGLDLLLDYFNNEKELHIHICAPINEEYEFKKIYKNELYNRKNIHTYGFIDLNSLEFRDLLVKCSFVILPSCSEGMPTSVLNVVGNGGLIPILTDSASIGIRKNTIKIEKEDIKSINKAVKESQEINMAALKKMSCELLLKLQEEYSIECFSKNMTENLKDIISQNDL